jgi:hypothetical protein
MMLRHSADVYRPVDDFRRTEIEAHFQPPEVLLHTYIKYTSLAKTRRLGAADNMVWLGGLVVGILFTVA